MKKILTLAGTVLIAMMLTACSPGIHTLGNSITFDSDGMVVHAAGQPSAHVSRNGGLSIDGKVVAVTPAQRQLLSRYYREARDAQDSGEAVGKQGVNIATRSIGDAISSIFRGNSSRAEKQLDAQSQQIEVAADKLCTDVKALGSTQKAIANGIPAFAPYVSGDQFRCTVTHTTIIKTDGAKSTSFTYSFEPAQSPHAITTNASTRHTRQSGESTTPTSSKP
ncbi:MAG: DUF2884 family protein [Rhodanobacteraceae bacterium]